MRRTRNRSSKADSMYLVTWSIDLSAASPQEAAQKALEIQRDPDSIALVFEVRDARGPTSRIDLWKKGGADAEVSE